MIGQFRIFSAAEGHGDPTKDIRIAITELNTEFFRLTAPGKIKLLGRDLPEIDLDFVATRRNTTGQRPDGAVEVHIAADQFGVGLHHTADQQRAERD
ncbi:hypothetical protein D3C81_972990 [compost metagenome]